MVPKKTTDNVVVYMLGGGSFYEYDTLQALATETNRNVSTFLSTKIIDYIWM